MEEGDVATILRHGSGSSLLGENQFEITLRENDDLDLFLACAISAGPNIIRLVDTETLELDEWVHIALTVDGGQLRLYKNAQLVGVTDYMNQINQGGENWLSIGAAAVLIEEEGEDPYFVMDEASPHSFYGFIDDLAIWHVTRTPLEIQAIYDAGLNGRNILGE